MKKKLNFKNGNILFVVKKGFGAYICAVKGIFQSLSDTSITYKCSVIYSKNKNNSNEVMVNPEDIKAYLGDDIDEAVEQYAEYFI